MRIQGRWWVWVQDCQWGCGSWDLLRRFWSAASCQSLKKTVTGMGGVSHNPTCTPQGPRAVQVLKGWKVAANHLLSRAYDTLQPALILSSGSGVPDSDGGGEDGLNDGRIEVHHHRLWQVELLQLPQEEHTLLCFLDEGSDVQIPF